MRLTWRGDGTPVERGGPFTSTTGTTTPWHGSARPIDSGDNQRFDQLYAAGSRLNQREAVAAARNQHGVSNAASYSSRTS